MILKLFHGSKLLGTISEPSSDGLWMVGTIQLTQEAEAYKDVFAFVTDEEKMTNGQEPPFDANYFFDNWFIEEVDGTRKETAIPGIHDGSEIYWRYC